MGVRVSGSTGNSLPKVRWSMDISRYRTSVSYFMSPGKREKKTTTEQSLSKTRICLYFCLDSSGKNLPKTRGAAECWRGNVSLVRDLLWAIEIKVGTLVANASETCLPWSFCRREREFGNLPRLFFLGLSSLLIITISISLVNIWSNNFQKSARKVRSFL